MITFIGYNLGYLGYNIYLYSNVIYYCYYGYYGYYGYCTLSSTVKKMYNVGKLLIKNEDINKQDWIML